MKSLLFLLLFCTCLINCFAQDTLVNFKENQDPTWGSVSAQNPNYGFYGQEFQFSKDAELYSFSVYIYNHPQHDETKSTINYSIWRFDTIPREEIFLSESVNITTEDINNWKKYEFKTPFQLTKGKYLLAVGQSKVQGFVAFGNGIAKDNYQSKLWVKTPLEGYSDGTKWFDFFDLYKIEKPTGGQPVVMMRLEYK